MQNFNNSKENNILINGNIAYTSQQAWLLNNTGYLLYYLKFYRIKVKYNILFDKPFISYKYEKVHKK